MFPKNVVSAALAIAILVVCIDQGEIFVQFLNRPESPNPRKFFFCSFFVWDIYSWLFPIVGLAIRCWNCNSRFNSGCADPFNNSTIGYLSECLPTFSLPNIQTVSQCRKIKHKGEQSVFWSNLNQKPKSTFSMTLTLCLCLLFVRLLHWENLENGVWSYIRGCNTNDQLNLYEATVYTCNQDGCNGANSNGPFATLALLATPVALLLRRTNLL